MHYVDVLIHDLDVKIHDVGFRIIIGWLWIRVSGSIVVMSQRMMLQMKETVNYSNETLLGSSVCVF